MISIRTLADDIHRLVFDSVLICGHYATDGHREPYIYPGAPVNTSVLWANVGGSLIILSMKAKSCFISRKWNLKLTMMLSA